MFVVPGVRSECLQGPDVGCESLKETKNLGQFYFAPFVVVSDIGIERLHTLLVSTVDNIPQIHNKHRFLQIMNLAV